MDIPENNFNVNHYNGKYLSVSSIIAAGRLIALDKLVHAPELDPLGLVRLYTKLLRGLLQQY